MTRLSTGLWSLAAALAAATLIQVWWWHPSCDRQDDGPGAYAFGFPLPYGEATGAASLSWTVMPHVYALNLVVLAALAWPLFNALLRRLWRRPRLALVSGIAGVACAALPPVAISMAGDVFPVWSIADGVYRRSWFDYRPVALALHQGHRACER